MAKQSSGKCEASFLMLLKAEIQTILLCPQWSWESLYVAHVIPLFLKFRDEPGLHELQAKIRRIDGVVAAVRLIEDFIASSEARQVEKPDASE